MKTIDFKQYNEKLKINPVSLDEFDKIKLDQAKSDKMDVFCIDNVKEYDIVKIRCGEYGIAFLLTTKINAHENNSNLDKIQDLLKKYKVDMFVSFEYENGYPTYMNFANFENKNLNRYGEKYDIVELWRTYEKIEFKDNDIFTDKALCNYINKYNYKLIFKDENN